MLGLLRSQCDARLRSDVNTVKGWSGSNYSHGRSDLSKESSDLTHTLNGFVLALETGFLEVVVMRKQFRVHLYGSCVNLLRDASSGNLSMNTSFFSLFFSFLFCSMLLLHVKQPIIPVVFRIFGNSFTPFSFPIYRDFFFNAKLARLVRKSRAGSETPGLCSLLGDHRNM